MQLLEEISRGDRSVSRIRWFAVALRSSLFELVCTGRGCRFVNVFSYNGFLLPHVRRRHDFLSRFQPYTSFDRNQPSAFFFASPLKPGTVFDATLLLVLGFSFHQERFSFRNSDVFLDSCVEPPSSFFFGSHFCLLCFPFSKFFLFLVFTLFLACLLP